MIAGMFLDRFFTGLALEFGCNLPDSKKVYDNDTT